MPNRKNIRLPKFDYSAPGYYFITICTHDRIPVFTNDPTRAVAAQCLVELPNHISGISIDTFCIMPDHVHAIVVIASVGAAYMPPVHRSKEILIRAIQQYKSAVTRLIQIHPLWQRGYYDHVIRNDGDLRETREYIRDNPDRVETKRQCFM